MTLLRRGGWLVVMLLAGLFAGVLLPSIGALTVPIGDGERRDLRFVSGFHEPEQLGETTIRWSTAEAVIRVPRLADGHVMRVSLRLLDARPTEFPAATVSLQLDQVDLGRFQLQRGVQASRRYLLLAPPSVAARWDTQLRLQSDTISTANDPRPLGVAVDQVVLEPLVRPWFAPWWYLLMSAGLALAAWVLSRALGASIPWAALLSLGLVALLLAASLIRPLELLPYLHRLLLLLLLMLVPFWVSAWLWPAAWSQDRRTLSGVALPMLLGIAFWMGPIFQQVMTFDGVDGVSPPVPTAIIGVGLAVLLVAVGLGRWLRPHLALHQWVVVVLAVAALAQLSYSIWFAFQRSGPDFWILFKGAREFARGGSMYDLVAVTTNHFGHVFKVPPFYGMLFLPWVFQDGEQILLYHRMLNVVLLSIAISVWFWIWQISPSSMLGASLLILLSFRPFADTIAYGQIDLALLLLLVVALAALRHGHDLWAGFLVALGTLFKVYPVVLLAFFVVKRRWWALLGFGLGMVVCNGLALVIVGWEQHRIYVFEVLPKISGTTSWVENQTVSGVIARLVSSPNDSGIFPNRTLTLLGLGLGALLGGLGCLLALRSYPPRSTGFALQYGLFLLLMVMVVPAAWMHYEVLLFVPYAALLLHLRERQVSPLLAATLALSFSLVAYGNQWSYFTGALGGVLTLVGVSYKFIGMLLLAGVLTRELLRPVPAKSTLHQSLASASY